MMTWRGIGVIGIGTRGAKAWLALGLIAAALFAAGCGGEGSVDATPTVVVTEVGEAPITRTPTPTETPSPTATPVPTATPTVAPTETATAEPTLEPTITPTATPELTAEEQRELRLMEAFEASGMEVTCSYVGTAQQILPDDIPGRENICYAYGDAQGHLQVLSPEREKIGTALFLSTHINQALLPIDGQPLPEGLEALARYRNDADLTVKSVPEIAEQAVADGFTLNLPRIERDANGQYQVGILEASILNTHFEITYEHEFYRGDQPWMDENGVYAAAYSRGGLYMKDGRLVVVMDRIASPSQSGSSAYCAAMTDYAIRVAEMLRWGNKYDSYRISSIISWIHVGGPWLGVLAAFNDAGLFTTVGVEEWEALQTVSDGTTEPEIGSAGESQ